jgi:nucleotide sugar dehydrogenase
MKIGFIGLGKVGKALYDVFTEYHTTSFYDIKVPNTRIEDVLRADIIVVAVPTPLNPTTQECDISIVESTVQTIKTHNYQGTICIKSTVIPGTTTNLIEKYKLRITVCPEFLKERQGYADIKAANLCIVGTEDPVAAGAVAEMYQPLNCKISQVHPTEAELTKYFQNVYNTQKILFANAFYEICKHKNVNYDNIIKNLEYKKSIDAEYLQCNETLRGPAGACLPKDTAAFNTFVKQLSLTPAPNIFMAMVNDMKIYPQTDKN